MNKNKEDTALLTLLNFKLESKAKTMVQPYREKKVQLLSSYKDFVTVNYGNAFQSLWSH